MMACYRLSELKAGIKFSDSPMGGQQLLVFQQLKNLVSNLRNVTYDDPQFLSLVQEFVSFYRGNVAFLMINKRNPFERMVDEILFTSGFTKDVADKMSQTCEIYTGILPRKEWFEAVGDGELNHVIQNHIAPLLLEMSREDILSGMECLFQEVLLRDMIPFDGHVCVAKELHDVISDWFLHM